MSGHSKWSTIKRQKGAKDLKRGMTFTKIANAISFAARAGGSGDPETNPRLRVALEQAKAVNMPKENIQRAIDRGLGKLPGQKMEEVMFEGFAPGRVGVIIEGVTDNKNRTLSEIRNILERNGGSLASQGAVSYMFEEVGEIKVKTKGGDKEEEMLELIDLGAIDVEEYLEETTQGAQQKYLVYTESSNLSNMSNLITQKGFTVEEASLTMRPKITQEVTDPDVAKKVIELAEKLEELDDVHKVYLNFDIPEGVMKEFA